MFDFEDAKDPLVNKLVGGICQLAGCLDGKPSAMHREEALHQVLKVAYELEDLMIEQNERISYLDRLAMTDSLTSILNIRGFEAELQRVLASARRFEETGVLAYIDLDGFKPINDTYGHACGDEVLRHTARLLEKTTRDMDYVARLGGDEFAVLLVRTSFEDGQKRVEKIAQELNNATINWRGHSIFLQASVGMHRYDESSLTHDLMSAADASMYAIKRLKTDIKKEERPLRAAE